MSIFGWATAVLIFTPYPSLLAFLAWCQPRFFTIALQTLRCSVCQHEPDMLPLNIEQQAQPTAIPGTTATA